MTDPTFTTRAELVAWVSVMARTAGSDPRRQIAALETIRRILAAHAHLGEG